MSKSDVHYSIYVKFNGNIYKLCTFIIKGSNGDLYLLPCMHSFIERDSVYEMDHISWHMSGQVHIKKKNGKYLTVEKALNRQRIDKTRRQVLFKIIINDVTKIHRYKKKTKKLDIIYRIDDCKRICLGCILFEGKHFIKLTQTGDKYFDDIHKSQNVIDYTYRAIGNKNINRQKCVLFVLYYDSSRGEIPHNIQIKIPFDERTKDPF